MSYFNATEFEIGPDWDWLRLFHFTGPYEYHTPPSEYNHYISQDQQYYQTIQKRLSNWFKPGIKRLSNWFKPGINRQTPPALVLPIITVVASFAIGAGILISKFIFNCYKFAPKMAYRKSCCFSIYGSLSRTISSFFRYIGQCPLSLGLTNENFEFVLILTEIDFIS